MYYLDNAATMSADSNLASVMNDCLYNNYGNPSSSHLAGRTARDVVEKARKKIADTISCKPNEIFFTSGGTESNNLALKGFAFANTCIIITTTIEHKSILETCKWLDKRGICEVIYIPVTNNGKIDMARLGTALRFIHYRGITPFVSIQMANSEIGTIQDIKDIASLVHTCGGILHVDAVQAYCSIPINVKTLGIDMMSVSGHKFGVPKGIGFLYKKSSIENIEPLLNGGGQEGGLRSGTESVPLIAALAKKASIETEKEKMENRIKKLTMVRDSFSNLITEFIPDSRINGTMKDRLPGNLNVSFKGVDGESLMMLLDNAGIRVSNGSACNSGNQEPSYVLRAIKVPEDYINGTIRITINDELSVQDSVNIVKEIRDNVNILRNATKGDNE